MCNKNNLENNALNGVDKFNINNILATSEYSKAIILNILAITSIAPDTEAKTYYFQLILYLKVLWDRYHINGNIINAK